MLCLRRRRIHRTLVLVLVLVLRHHTLEEVWKGYYLSAAGFAIMWRCVAIPTAKRHKTQPNPLRGVFTPSLSVAQTDKQKARTRGSGRVESSPPACPPDRHSHLN